MIPNSRIFAVDDKINYIMEGLIYSKFPHDWGAAVEFSENIYDELERNFFNNNCLNIFYFNIFIREILPEDLVIYIAKIFFNLFINNESLEKAIKITSNYDGDTQMILNFSFITENFRLSFESSDFSVSHRFLLNIECCETRRSILENDVSLSSEETYKYLKIILNEEVKIYDIFCGDIFSNWYNF